jgi:hypothetical protein
MSILKNDSLLINTIEQEKYELIKANEDLKYQISMKNAEINKLMSHDKIL